MTLGVHREVGAMVFAATARGGGSASFSVKCPDLIIPTHLITPPPPPLWQHGELESQCPPGHIKSPGPQSSEHLPTQPNTNAAKPIEATSLPILHSVIGLITGTDQRDVKMDNIGRSNFVFVFSG